MTGLREIVRTSRLGPFARKVRDTVVSIRPQTNSAFCWIKAGEGVSTRIYIYNYWSESYGIARPRTRWTMHAADGRRVARGQLVLEPRELRVLDVDALLRSSGVAMPFEGNFVIRLSSRRLRRGMPLQLWGEYHSAGDAISCVHGQWGYFEPWRRPGPTGGHMVVRADERYETFIVPQNCAPAGPPAAPAFVVYRADGVARRAPAAAIARNGFARYSIRDLVPDGAEFLAGQLGNASVHMERPSIRTLHFHRHRDGSVSVNHAAGDYAAAVVPVPAVRRAQVARFGRGPMAVAVGWEDGVVRSDYVLHNNLWPVAPHAYEIRVNALDGRPVVAHGAPIVLNPRETRVLALADLLDAADAPRPFRGVVEVALAVPAGDCPSGFQLVTELWAGDRLAASDVGSDLFNVTPGRTKIFSRVLETADFETLVFLAYPALDTTTKGEVTVEITLIASDGRAQLQRSATVAVHGALFDSIRNLFPEALEFLASGGGTGTLKARCAQARLFGYHIVRHKRSGALACDHLIGG